MSSDLAFSIGLLAGWLALVVWMTWPSNHDCHDDRCERKLRDKLPK